MAQTGSADPLLGNVYWDVLDAVRGLLGAKRWQTALLDCSKNELLALMHVYRAGETTMSQVADYVAVPLNTATGIANRLERRGLVERWRSVEDKRVVVVRITDQGKRQIENVLENVNGIIEDLFAELDHEEIMLLVKVMKRVPSLLEREAAAEAAGSEKKKRVQRIEIE